MKKLWIDDLRDPPDETWEVVRTAHRAICLLEDNEYEEVSFDNDLGYESLYGNKMLEGRNILGWLRNRQANGLYVPPELKVHTSNPDASQAMENDIQRMIGFEIVKNITAENTHPETDWGKPQGKEILRSAYKKVLPDKIAGILDKTFGHDSWDDKPRD